MQPSCQILSQTRVELLSRLHLAWWNSQVLIYLMTGHLFSSDLGMCRTTMENVVQEQIVTVVNIWMEHLLVSLGPVYWMQHTHFSSTWITSSLRMTILWTMSYHLWITHIGLSHGSFSYWMTLEWNWITRSLKGLKLLLEPHIDALMFAASIPENVSFVSNKDASTGLYKLDRVFIQTTLQNLAPDYVLSNLWINHQQ